MKTPKITQILNPILTAACLAAGAVAIHAQSLPCTETNGVKFLSLPQVDGGLDVLDIDTNGISGIVLADDFGCNTPGPVTDIHLWGSWLSDIKGTITNAWIGIYGDVPAVTNLASGMVTPSHPGDLLWHQIFGPGDYAENPYATGSEGFYDPAIYAQIGNDTQSYYYCFYPTNPFVQNGTRANPTNYWLAVYVKVAGGNPGTYGWKTATSHYNDGAVWGTVQPATGLPIGDWQTMTNNQTQQLVDLSFMLNTPTNPPVQPACLETNGVKYVQGPDLYSGLGLDVWNCSLFPPGATDGPWWLADDFICTNTGPITDIHLWGSWLNDVPLTNTITFQLYLMDDVPAVIGSAYIPSHPGTNVLWHQTFTPGSYAETIWANNASENFMDPGAGNLVGGDSVVWYYCFQPTNLNQYGTMAVPQTNWLVVFAELPVGVGNEVFGWKTTTNVQNDISVHMKWNGFGTAPTNSAGWSPTYESGPVERAVDLAFELNTATNPPAPQTQCVETNGVKYVQDPNLNGGFDVWNEPYVLADDFVCTNSGPISDIHIWGSWLNNQVDQGAITFWLGIYDDVPLNATNTAFSYPGKLLWQQWFAPGQYAENPYATGSENFLDPGPPNILGPDNLAWYYCFYPTNPLIQLGSTAAPKTYWIAANAQLPNGVQYQYGWKTAPAVENDVSVYAPWPGVPPAGNPGWTPTFTPIPPTGGPATPLDLAFKITTATNRCAVPVNVLCPEDKTVECGSTWTFDPPLIGPDSCCSSNPVVTCTTVTNVFGPCQQSITRTYYISDCIGFIGACSQTVTVEDTNPPVFTSFPTNLVAYTCDTDTPVFWFVTATDACSSVTITSTPPVNFPFPALSTNTVTVTAVDACGNATNKSFQVAVVRPVVGPLYIQYLGTNSMATNNYVVTWTNGILQVSVATNLMNTTNVLGPYVDVPGALSPYTNTTTLPAKFYRLRCY